MMYANRSSKISGICWGDYPVECKTTWRTCENVSSFGFNGYNECTTEAGYMQYDAEIEHQRKNCRSYKQTWRLGET
jgi:hypothetical protein